MSKRSAKTHLGKALSDHVTALGLVDGGGKEPVHIVWHHRAWCPMACKVFETPERAQKECRILEQCAHPNIVRSMGIEDERLLLMEFLEGPSLYRLIEDSPHGRLGISDAIRVAIHVGSALQHVHRCGYLHMDVKPDNVIVARSGKPVLFDFGSARAAGARRPDRVVGTDPYIAPEECRLERAGPPADVFSLGVSLFEALTGELPFGPTTKRKPWPQVETDALPARHYRKNVPSELDAIVQSCLSRDPNDRPTLARLLPALHAHVSVGPPMWPAGFRPQG